MKQALVTLRMAKLVLATFSIPALLSNKGLSPPAFLSSLAKVHPTSLKQYRVLQAGALLTCASSPQAKYTLPVPGRYIVTVSLVASAVPEFLSAPRTADPRGMHWRPVAEINVTAVVRVSGGTTEEMTYT